jgi:hypothetical protein
METIVVHFKDLCQNLFGEASSPHAAGVLPIQLRLSVCQSVSWLLFAEEQKLVYCSVNA